MAVDPLTGQTQVSLRPTYAMGQALLQQGRATQPNTWVEALGGLAQQLSGRYLTNKAAEQQEARQAAAMDTLERALAMATGQDTAGQTPSQGPQAASPQAGQQQSVADVLLSNPITARTYGPTLLSNALQGQEPQGGYTVLTDEEKAALGIPENVFAQRDASGQISFEKFGGGLPETGITVRGPGGAMIRMGGSPYGPEYTDKFASELGKTDVQAIEKTRQTAMAAQEQLNRINRMEELYGDLDTGIIAPVELMAAQAVSAVGGNPESFDLIDPQKAEAARALSNEATMYTLSKMSGQSSDRDIIFAKNSNATLSNTPGGNRKILAFQRGVALRQIERAKQLEDWINENGSSRGFTQYWAAYNKANPIVEEVFGENVDEVMAQVTPGEQEAEGGQEFDVPISEMTGVQLQKLDPANMTLSQMEAAAQRWEEINAE